MKEAARINMALPSEAAKRAVFATSGTRYDKVCTAGDCDRRSFETPTVGAIWPWAWFVSEKVNLKPPGIVERSAVSPKTSLPLDMVHVPVLLTAGMLLETSGKLLLDGVVLPVRPVRVIIGRPPGLSAAVNLQLTSSGTLGAKLTVMVFTEHGHGVLWLAAPVQVTPRMFITALSPVPVLI